MPEIIELKIASQLVQSKADYIFDKIEFSTVTKNPRDWASGFNQFKIQSHSRGKEMKVAFLGEQEITLRFNLGMSGNWKWQEFSSVNEAYSVLEQEKHHHLRLYSGSKVLTFWDPRRFGHWVVGDWSTNRGPDPLQEFPLFCANLAQPGRWMNQPLYEVLMDQKLFNGVGNYLRSEILDRSGFSPFLTWASLSTNEKEILMSLCQTVPLEVETLGGGQLKDWSNPNGVGSQLFKEWLQCYGKKKSFLDKSQRNFWLDEKWLNN